MLAEERFSLIMEQLNRKRTVTVQELCEALNTSESTIRRDLTELDRLGKLNDMRDKLAAKLADPELYEDSRKGDLAVWNKKYAEVMDALDRAEAMWLDAQEKLEKAA